MKTLIKLAVPTALILATTAYADRPARNVSAARHANLAAAQQLTNQAYSRLNAAQQANEFDMGGHAARAKELLRQASDEMKLAALAANRR
jgi:hypothetical protein